MSKHPIPGPVLEKHVGILGRSPKTVGSTEVDKAYAAGFFDGEGHITIAANAKSGGSKGRTFNMRIGASQNEIGPLVWLRDRWGGSIRSVKRKTASGMLIRLAPKAARC